MTQTGFDGLALAQIFFVNNYFGAGFTRAFRGFVARAVIDDQNVIELLASPTNYVADVLLFVVSGNDRRDLRFHPSADDRMKIGRVIRAAHQRPGRDVLESFFARDLTVKIELRRRDEFYD